MERPPIAWVGGKSRLRVKIIERIPEHKCYVEVFGGAAWVLFGKEPSKAEVYNDLDGALVNLYRVLKHRPAEFAESYRNMFPSREIFKEYAHATHESNDEMERAHRFYYHIRLAFGTMPGSKQYGYGRTRKQNLNLADIREIAQRASERLRRVNIENVSYQELFRRYDSNVAFFFCDPPYYETTVHNFNFKDEDFVQLSATLLGIKGKFLLTLNDTKRTREIFGHFNIEKVNVLYSLRQKSKNKNHKELFITNY